MAMLTVREGNRVRSPTWPRYVGGAEALYGRGPSRDMPRLATAPSVHHRKSTIYLVRNGNCAWREGI